MVTQPAAKPTLRNATLRNVILLLVAILCFALLLVQSVNNFPHDFQINIKETQNFLRTGILYSWTPASAQSLFYSYISTPFVAVALSPLASLDQNTALGIYRLVSVLAYTAAIVLISHIHHLRSADNSTTAGWSWLIMLLWLPTQDSISLGQINEVILLCLVVGYWGWMTNRDDMSGIGVGLAAALKVTPILLVLLFLFSGRWRAAVITLIVATLLGGVSCAAVGVDQCVAFGTTIFPNISRGSADYYHVGLNGLVYRFLTANNIAYWTNLQPPPETFIGRVLPVIELLAFIGLGYINARRNPQNTQGKAALFSLWIAGILLTAPITWWHYTTWLLMGMPTLIKFALHTKRRLRLLLVIGLLLINLSPYVMLGIGLLSGSHVLAYALLALPCLGLIIICLFFWIIQAGTRLNRVDAPADAN